MILSSSYLQVTKHLQNMGQNSKAEKMSGKEFQAAVEEVYASKVCASHSKQANIADFCSRSSPKPLVMSCSDPKESFLFRASRKYTKRPPSANWSKTRHLGLRFVDPIFTRFSLRLISRRKRQQESPRKKLKAAEKNMKKARSHATTSSLSNCYKSSLNIGYMMNIPNITLLRV